MNETMIIEDRPEPRPQPELAAPYEPDTKATWHYWTELDTKERGIPEEWVWERLRNRRDFLLSDTDYRMVSDSPWQTEPWATYRKALRDLPNKTSDPRLAEWPVKP